MEKTLKSGVYLVCPNNPKKSAAAEVVDKAAKKGKKKAVVGDSDGPILCHFTKRLGDAPEKLPAIPPPVTAAAQAQPVA